jgi:hypothetical protein
MEFTTQEETMTVFSIIFVAFCVLVLIWDHRRPKMEEQVTVTEEEVIRTMKNGRQEKVRWDELVEVGILTTDEGPFGEDVFWILIGAGGAHGCAAPQGARGSEDLLKAFQERLPGFDNEAVIRAMGSTSNDRFVCWRKACP